MDPAPPVDSVYLKATALAPVVDALLEVSATAEAARRARVELGRAVADAEAAGVVSQADLATVLGVSRRHVRHIVAQYRRV